MIQSFKCRETERIFDRIFSKKLPNDIQRVALRKLRMLNRATIINDPKVPPSNRLDQLKGNRKGQHSIRIYDQWRICFRWPKGDAFAVEIVDYQ